MNATPETLPDTPVAVAPAAGSKKFLLIAVGLVILLFAATYILAWFRSLTLTQQYLEQADRSYQQGDYLQSLTGFQEFDEDLNRYITRGGYFQVERIWAHNNAWPVPNGVQTARVRIDEIIDERITIPQAEAFIQTTAGRNNPYMGIIYLRLGELYEEEGDLRDAREIYESIPQLFAREPELIERAQAHLARLGAEE